MNFLKLFLCVVFFYANLVLSCIYFIHQSKQFTKYPLQVLAKYYIMKGTPKIQEVELCQNTRYCPTALHTE